MVGQGRLRPGGLVVRFRAAGHDEMLRALARRHGVEALVELLPPIPYRAALDEMLRADGLLVLQASNCNEQIPAKLYEYLRAGRPIVALTDPAGDTAGVVRDAGLDTIARLDSADDIAALLERFVASLPLGQAPLPDAGYVAQGLPPWAGQGIGGAAGRGVGAALTHDGREHLSAMRSPVQHRHRSAIGPIAMPKGRLDAGGQTCGAWPSRVRQAIE